MSNRRSDDEANVEHVGEPTASKSPDSKELPDTVTKVKKKKKKPTSNKPDSKNSGKKKGSSSKNSSSRKGAKRDSKKAAGSTDVRLGATSTKGGAKTGGKSARKVSRDGRGDSTAASTSSDSGFAGRLRRWSAASPLAKMMDRKERSAAKVLDTPKVLKRRREPKPFWPSIDMEAFGAWSERFARFMGTPKFLVQMTVFVVAWLLWNTLTPKIWQFDPRELNYTLLTLILSLQASYAAPLILLAQNRQDDRDRVALEQDRQQTQRALADTEYMTREVASLRLAVSDLATRDYLRSELREVLEEVRQLTEALGDHPHEPQGDVAESSSQVPDLAQEAKPGQESGERDNAGSSESTAQTEQADMLDTPQLRERSGSEGFFDDGLGGGSGT